MILVALMTVVGLSVPAIADEVAKCEFFDAMATSNPKVGQIYLNSENGLLYVQTEIEIRSGSPGIPYLKIEKDHIVVTNGAVKYSDLIENQFCNGLIQPNALSLYTLKQILSDDPGETTQDGRTAGLSVFILGKIVTLQSEMFKKSEVYQKQFSSDLWEGEESNLNARHSKAYDGLDHFLQDVAPIQKQLEEENQKLMFLYSMLTPATLVKYFPAQMILNQINTGERLIGNPAEKIPSIELK